MTQKINFLKQNCLVYTRISNKITCGKLKIKFPDFSPSLNKDLEIPRPDTKLPDFSLTLNTSVLSIEGKWLPAETPARNSNERPFPFLL